MVEVIDLSRFRKQKKENRTLNDFLKEAALFIKGNQDKEQDELKIVSKETLGRLLESNFLKEVVEKEMISSDIFFCVSYVANVIIASIRKFPGSIYSFDNVLSYQETGNPFFLQQGGDACFLICSVFSDRANWRTMKEEDYKKIGSSFYYWFYSLTGKEIGYYMSYNFESVVGIIKESINKLS